MDHSTPHRDAPSTRAPGALLTPKPSKPTEPFGIGTPARVFRWPGAKWHACEALAPRLREHLDATGGRLLSLFHGAGALEQTVASTTLIAADANPDLRVLYAELARDGGAEAFHELVKLDDLGAPRPRREFARIRAINPQAMSPAARAARFLWLSGLAFNGIWRVNREGLLNVPPDARRLEHPWPFPVRSELAAAARGAPSVPLFDDWRRVIDLAQPGDLILSDPPYLSGFNSYTQGRFTLAEQHLLAIALRGRALAGCAVVAFNSADAHPLYRSWANIEPISRPGRMNCRPSRRGPVGELLATIGLHGQGPQTP